MVSSERGRGRERGNSSCDCRLSDACSDAGRVCTIFVLISICFAICVLFDVNLPSDLALANAKPTPQCQMEMEKEISLQMVSQRLEMTTTTTATITKRNRAIAVAVAVAVKGVTQLRVPPPVCHAALAIFMCVCLSLFANVCLVCVCVSALLQSSIRQAGLARKENRGRERTIKGDS